MVESLDWYPTTGAGERAMYANIEAKIDGYQAKYPACLTPDYVDDIHTFCRAFIEGYDKIEQNRVSGKQATAWFENLVRSKQENTPAPAPPIYQTIAMPVGTMLGVEKACRDFRNLFVKQLNYDRADGIDLMLERAEGEDLNLNDAQPALKIARAGDVALQFTFKIGNFDALELQCRKVGTTLWQAADKSTTNTFDFAPPLTEPGVPEKFEFRAIYLIKNQRVGQWSPIYTETFG